MTIPHTFTAVDPVSGLSLVFRFRDLGGGFDIYEYGQDRIDVEDYPGEVDTELVRALIEYGRQLERERIASGLVNIRRKDA